MSLNRLLFCLQNSLILFLVSIATSQEKKELKYAATIYSDNDAFIFWQNSDRFYSFGLGLKVAIKPDKFLGLEKKIINKKDFFIDFEIKSEGYTASNPEISLESILNDSIDFDRPFAGLLFSKTGITYSFERLFFRGELLLGVMGPSAFTREIQDWVHKKITGDGVLSGWDFQIPDQIIFNTNFKGLYDLTPNYNGFDVYSGLEARVGNLYIDTTPLVGIRIGKFGPLASSTAFGNTLLGSTSLREIYIKSSLSATVNWYDATAQGNIFNRDYEYAVKDLNHLHTSMTHGVYIRTKRLSIGFDHIFTYGKIIKGERHVFGRFEFTYLF